MNSYCSLQLHTCTVVTCIGKIDDFVRENLIVLPAFKLLFHWLIFDVGKLEECKTLWGWSGTCITRDITEWCTYQANKQDFRPERGLCPNYPSVVVMCFKLITFIIVSLKWLLDVYGSWYVIYAMPFTTYMYTLLTIVFFFPPFLPSLSAATTFESKVCCKSVCAESCVSVYMFMYVFLSLYALWVEPPLQLMLCNG